MRCKACGERIIFLITKNKKWIPVDMDSISEEDISYMASRNEDDPLLEFKYGEHITHFTTCPNADDFRDQGKTQ